MQNTQYRSFGLVHIALSGLLCAPGLAGAETSPINVRGCDIAKNPSAFVGTPIRVRGRLSVHFEDFSLEISDCEKRQGIWLAFGGDVPGLVPSTFNDMVRRPGSDIKVDGIAYGIKKDVNFWKLYALVAARHGDKPDYQVTATLTGVFLGTEVRDSKGEVLYFGGFGHLGCCALIMISEVSDVTSVPRANLDVHGVVVGIDGQPVEGFTVIDDILGGSPPGRRTTITDKQGKFAFSNSGQQLRFESPDYRPLALAVEAGGPEIRVKLESAAQSDWTVSTCKDGHSSKRVGFSIRFALPEAMESELLDFDGRQSIFIYQRGGSVSEAELIMSRIVDGTIETVNSLGYEWFEERWVKDDAGRILGIDARGQMRGGGSVRTVVFSDGVVATYSLERSKTRTALDLIIDSACVAKDASR